MDETRRRFLRLGGLTAVGTLAGCAGSPGTETTDGTTVDARGQDTLTVTVGAFDSPAVWVDPGTTVTWEWTGSGGSHNIVAADDVFRSGDPTGSGSYEHVFESEGTHTYYCDPHRGVGMRGAVVVGQPGSGSQRTREYDWQAATFDSYWYSLCSMSTNIAMSGNGVPFPLNDQMEQLRDKRLPAIIENADTDRPPIANPNLSLASFTEGDPHFTQQPVFDDGSGRPDASTLAWDKSESSRHRQPVVGRLDTHKGRDLGEELSGALRHPAGRCRPEVPRPTARHAGTGRHQRRHPRRRLTGQWRTHPRR